MDALLAPEARQALEALALSRSPASAGILFGHKRGSRFIIESALPTTPGYYPPQRTYLRLSAAFSDRIIGFFSFSAESGLRKISPPPFAVGKVFLSLKAGPDGRLFLRGHSPDYSRRFILRPVPLAKVKGRKL
jgi:hypothetical protein